MSLADTSNTRLLPKSVAASMHTSLLQVCGFIFVTTALAAWVALGSWSIGDPSLTNSVAGTPHNLLGKTGASFSDLFFQIFGLASIFLILPLFTIGVSLLVKRTMSNMLLRILAWPLGIAILAAAFSNIQAPFTWPLPTGLGGFLGDNILLAAREVAGLAFLPAGFLHIAFAMLLPAIGIWMSLYAAGIGKSYFALLMGGGAAHQAVVQNRLHGEGLVNRLESVEGREADWEADANIPVVGTVRSSNGNIQPPSARPAQPDFMELTKNKPHQPVGEPNGPQAAVPVHTEVTAEPKRFFSFGAARAAAKPVSTIAPVEAVTTMRGKSAANLPAPGNYLLPSLDHLTAAKTNSDATHIRGEELQGNAKQLLEVLEDFGVRGQIIDVKPGPVVTLYELEPDRGVKAARIISLAEDIARYMSAVSARVAVISGKNVIGIELPNKKRQIVYMREQLESQAANMDNYKLPLVLGKDIGGSPVTVDLASMPHLLIAGTTGSGKSVGINTMILSLLYSLTPEQCKFIMIDPKMLELSVYDGIPHLLSPVVTDPKKAVVALKWTVKEMEERYRKMSKLGVRNIMGFNAKVDEARARGETMTRTVQTGFEPETGEAVYEQEELEFEKLPYIVVVVDEMADLMVVAGKEIEGTIQRLAQMARAAGIHIIMATQRPSVDVITGTIKANFPTRISFQVTSKIDSRTILGEQGAEQLLGKGDMLYMGSGIKVERVHGAFVSDQEVEEIASFLKSQGVPQYLDAVTRDEEAEAEAAAEAAAQKSSSSSGADKNEALYDEAVAIVMRDQKASTSYIQRRLSIGYNRAATLIERMENEGIISPANNVGKRDILRGGADPDVGQEENFYDDPDKRHY